MSTQANGSNADSPHTIRITRLFMGLVQRDIRIAWSQGGTTLLALGFFLIAVCLFPFGVGPNPAILGRIAVGVIWVVALLASVLSFDRLYLADYEDGSLDDLALSPLGLMGVVIAKTAAHWLSTALPLALIAPLLALLLNMPEGGYMLLFASLMLGTPALSLIGSFGATLMIAVRKGGVLMFLIVLPFYIPTLIFGVGAVDAGIYGLNPVPHLSLLAATSMLSALVGIAASVGALKLALE